MASSLSDFSQLKALKKELEKREPAPSRAGETASGTDRNIKRSRVRTVKTREEMQGAQAARERGLREGMAITLMDSSDRGTIKAIWKDHVDIEIDGLTFTAGFGEFIVNDAAEDERMRRSIFRDKDRKEQKKAASQGVPGEITVDLHIERIPGGMDAPEGFELPFQIEYFKRIIRQYRKHRGMRINVVHGVGDGILHDAVRKEVEETFALSCSWYPGPAGVTIVTVL